MSGRVGSTARQRLPSGTDRCAVVGTDEIRALVNITGPDAPERYAFPFGGQVASLALQPDGSVLDASMRRVNRRAPSPPPGHEMRWARGAHALRGAGHRAVIQVVEHIGRGFQYGITADPSFKRKWWGYTVSLNKADVSNVAAASAAGRRRVHRRAKVPHPAAKAAIAAVAYLFVQTAKGAKKYGRCMIWHATWVQPTAGWWTFPALLARVQRNGTERIDVPTSSSSSRCSAVALAMRSSRPALCEVEAGAPQRSAGALAFCGVLAISQFFAEDLATGLVAGAVAALAVALPPTLALRRAR